jgi:hypothetical protein
MDMLKKLSPQAQVVFAGTVLYVIFSFFDWQQVCFNADVVSACGGVSEWHGFGGTITVLSALLLLAWEVVRLLNVKIELGGVSHGLISVALALLLLLLTIITFLSHNEARHWPSYIGLVLAIVIAGAAFMRGKDEGVQVPDFASMAGGGSSTASTAAPSAPAPSTPAPVAPTPPPAAEPPAPPAPPPAAPTYEPPTSGDEPPAA